MENPQNKLYKFNLSLQDARTIIFALKDKPMKEVEGIVATMDTQFSEQLKAEQAAEIVNSKVQPEQVNDNNSASTPSVSA